MLGTYDLLNGSIPINELWKVLFPGSHKDVDYDYSVICPFHYDTQPSLRIYQQGKNYVRCFGLCNRGWEVVDLVREAKGISKLEAFSWLADVFSLDISALQRITAISKVARPRTDIEEMYRESQEEWSYLKGRGISEETQRRFRVRNLGGFVLMPHFKWGILRAISGRSVTDQEPKHMLWEGPLGESVFGIDEVGGSTVIVCESPIDALSFQEIGLPAVSVRLAKISDEMISDLSGFGRVLIATDGDDRGEKGARELRRRLKTLVSVVPIPRGEDVNSLLMKGSLRNLMASYLGTLNDNRQFL